MVYSENMGVVDLTSDATVAFSVSDANEDVHDFNYQLIKTVPGSASGNRGCIEDRQPVFGYTDEADYQVKVYSVDKAGNRSAERNYSSVLIRQHQNCRLQDLLPVRH